MKRMLPALLALAAAFAASGQTLTVDTRTEEPLIFIEAWGNVRVQARAGETVSMSLTRTNRGSTGVAHDRNPSGLVASGKKWVAWSDVAGDVELFVPPGSRLVVHSYRWGDVEIRDVCGDLEVTSHEGGVRLFGAGGAVVAHAANGPIRAEFVWATPLPTILTSMHGAIEIAIPPEVRLLARLRTREGRILSAVPWQEGLRPSDSHIEEVQLFAYTRFGPITLSKKKPDQTCR